MSLKGIDNLHGGGFIKAFERQSFSNDGDLVRSRIDNRPGAIPIAPGIIVRECSSVHTYLCFLAMRARSCSKLCSFVTPR